MAKKNKILDKKEKRAQEFIDISLSLHDDDWTKTADRLRNQIKGNWHRGFNGRDRVVVNEAFSLVNLILPHFILNNPYVTANPDNAKWLKKIREGVYQQRDAGRMARNMEATLNHHIKKTRHVFEDRKAIQDHMAYPFGVTKDGYAFETMSEGSEEYITKDAGYHMRINPRDFGWHPMATSPDDSPWLLHRVVLTEEECERRKIKTDNLEPGIPEYQKKELQNKAKKNKSYEDDYYTFYEVSHQDGNKIYLFGGENKELIEKKDMDYPFSCSAYNVLTFTKDNDDFMGIPLLKMVEPQMWLLNELLSLMIEHIRKFPGQVFANESAVDEDQEEKIIRGRQGSLHRVKDINGLLRTNPLQMGQEYFQIFNLVTSIIDRILGVPDFQRLTGGSANRMSATAASFIQGDSTVRRNYFASIVKEYTLRGIEKQAAFKQKYQDEKEYIQASAELQNDTFELTKEDYQGDYIYDFDIDTMGAVNEAEMNNLNNMMMMMSKNPFFEPVLRKLDADKTGKKFFGLAKINYESLTRQGVEEGIVYSPEKENQMAMDFIEKNSGVPMPRPNRNEQKDMHIESHKKFLDARIKGFTDPRQAVNDPVVNMLMEHIAETEMIGEDVQIPQEQAVPQNKTQPEMMQPEGPMGPMQGLPQ